jgi:hypothetical protein
MNPKLKLILTISLKQAIGAVLASSLIASQWRFIFNFDNHAGQLAVLRLLGSIVVGREIQVWGSKVGKWIFSNNDPSELDKLDVAEAKAKESESKAHEAVTAVQDAKASVKP